MSSGQLSALDSHIFSIIAKLKQQSNIGSIHAHIIKTIGFEEITKGNLQERMNSLIFDGKIVNKSNRNRDSH